MLAFGKSLSRLSSEGESNERLEGAGLTGRIRSYEDNFGKKYRCTHAFKKKREGLDRERSWKAEKLLRYFFFFFTRHLQECLVNSLRGKQKRARCVG